ncbi:MAG: DUF5519 family protein [Pseudonocardia sp.]|nr:DUF5519 family protein [Pseudonocardia sp.]
MKGRLAVAAVAAAAGWAVRDYRKWRGLGVGGLPPTVGGWITVTGMRLRGRDPFEPLDPGEGDVSRVLLDLAPRAGDRPEVGAHPVPHRVLEQRAPEPVRAELHQVVAELATRPGLELRTSRWEKHHEALWRAGGDEIAHVHPSDGSLHVVLGAVDARLVVKRRWGEYHPLAGVMLGLPATYTLLYPPRTSAEVAVLRTILAAAIEEATR